MKVFVNLNIDKESASQIVSALEKFDLNSSEYFSGLKQQIVEGVQQALYLLENPIPEVNMIRIEFTLNYIVVEAKRRE